MGFPSSINTEFLLNSLSDAYILLDSDGFVQFNNKACETLFAYQQNELLHKHLTELIPQTEISKHPVLQHFHKPGWLKDIESIPATLLTAKKKDQSLFPVELSISPLRHDKEDCLICIIRNLSSLLSSHNKVSQVLSSTDIILYTLELTDTNLKAIWVSPNITAQLGYTTEEVYSENWWSTNIHPDDKDRVHHNFDNFLQTGVLEHEYRFLTKNNGYIWFQDKLKLDSQSAPHLIYGSWNDISDKKRQLASLMENKERMSQSQIFANIGTWDWNIQTGELYWSEMIPPLFGYAAGQLETSYANFVTAIHPEDLENVLNAINQCLESKLSYDIQHRVIWPDGTVRWVNEKGAATFDNNDMPLHMLGVIIDIHEHKTLLIRQQQQQEELIAAKEIAEAANKAKTVFLSSMSHELRTPLNTILGFSQLLQLDSSLNSEACENVSSIIDSGEHLLALINNVLDLAKIESGNAAALIEAVSIIDLFDICKTMSQSLADKYNIEVIFTTACYKDYSVQADFLKLKQIIYNLLSNAIMYNKENGQVIVDCVINELDNKITILVKDTGPGMTADKLAQLFIPFNRLGGESTSHIRGTGIGLVITRNLLTLIDSELTVSSTPGKGSEFSFKLPLLNTSAALERE
ncbi:MAG: PAS domain-containing protein [Gammaproteobacteria bacterium]|nr:PAS domain-containing protein [Gammaproteobacteria bacterium]